MKHTVREGAGGSWKRLSPYFVREREGCCFGLRGSLNRVRGLEDRYSRDATRVCFCACDFSTQSHVRFRSKLGLQDRIASHPSVSRVSPRGKPSRPGARLVAGNAQRTARCRTLLQTIRPLPLSHKTQPNKKSTGTTVGWTSGTSFCALVKKRLARQGRRPSWQGGKTHCLLYLTCTS